MSTPLRLAAALLVPLLLLAGCGDDEPDKSESTSEPSGDESSEPTDEATTESTTGSTEATESESASSEPTEEASDTPTVAVSATPQADDDCTLIPTTAVTEAFGEEMDLIGAGAQTCIFNGTSTEVGLSINLTAIEIDPEKYADGARDQCEGPVRNVRVGDDAFTCIGPIGPQGLLFSGSDGWVLTVEAADDAAGLDLAAVLLKSVILE
jgi:hypothetical protein